MKKILLLVFLVWGSLHLCAQNDYYWSSGKKIHLTTDSSTVIIKTRTSGDLKNAASRFKSLARGAVALSNIDSVHMVIKYNGKAVLSDIASTLPGNTVKPGDIIFAHLSNRLPFNLTGTILYQLNDGKSLNDVLTLLSKEEDIKQHIDQYKIVHLTPGHLDRVLSIANTLYESGLVKWCHPDFITAFKLDTNDPLYANQYHLKNNGQTGGTSGVDINVEPAWNAPGSNTVIRVAVIDNGVEAHEDLAGRVVPGFTAGNLGTGAQINNVAGHGEACAGIIAASKNNSLGVAGICANCQIVPVNIFTGPVNPQYAYDNNNAASVGDIAASINWAWNPTQGNADVLSCSWGGGSPADVITFAINDARTLGRANKGAVVVFSAGNFQNGSTAAVAYPANVPGVISVGAIDKNGNRWNYSPNSPAIVAPSGNAGTLAGDLYTTDRMGSNGYSAGNYAVNFGGTSAACPQVAGVAALMLSINPSLTEAQVKSKILSTATPMFNSVSFGAGRLNAGAAVQSVLPVVVGPDAFCSTTAVYTVNNAPPGATITWSTTNSGVISLSPSGTQVTVTRISAGYTTLLAFVNGTQLPPRNLTVGSSASISAMQSGECHDGKMTWLLTATPNSTPNSNWQWTVDDPNSGTYYISNPNSPSTSVTVQGGGYVSVSYTDACGQTSMYSGALVYSPCPTSFMNNITAYPNPANSQLSIKGNSMVSAANAPAKTVAPGTGKDNYFEAKLYNEKGLMLRSAKSKTETDTVNFDTSGIPDGIYYLHIFQGGQKTIKQIMIRH
jgi:serine protease